VRDKRSQPLRAAVGFAECSLPSYDRASCAADRARLLVRHRACRRRHGTPGLRSPAHAVRRERLARDLLQERIPLQPSSATTLPPLAQAAAFA